MSCDKGHNNDILGKDLKELTLCLKKAGLKLFRDGARWGKTAKRGGLESYPLRVLELLKEVWTQSSGKKLIIVAWTTPVMCPIYGAPGWQLIPSQGRDKGLLWSLITLKKWMDWDRNGHEFSGGGYNLGSICNIKKRNDCLIGRTVLGQGLECDSPTNITVTKATQIRQVLK